MLSLLLGIDSLPMALVGRHLPPLEQNINPVLIKLHCTCIIYMYIIFIFLPSQVDSNSFFLDHSYGANSEVAGIVTLLTVVDQLGRLKCSSDVSKQGLYNRVVVYVQCTCTLLNKVYLKVQDIMCTCTCVCAHVVKDST